MSDRKLLNIELGRVTPAEYKELPPSGLVVVLDNIRSAHNVGSAEIRKSALGAEDAVPWAHFDDTMDAVAALKAEGYTLVAVEQTVHSRKLGKDFRREPDRKYALVFGNEVYGVRQDVVDACDLSLEIPQYGTKHSLNVSVSVGVVLWEMVR